MKTLEGGIQFNALPFGLQCSPYWTHKLARPLISYLRNLGVKLVWYVDDILILGTCPADVRSSLATAVRLFNDVGVQVNWTKSTPTPTQRLEYLGQILDLGRGLLHPPEAKLRATRGLARKTRRSKTATPARLASIAGQVLDLAKTCINLHGLPKALMAMAGRMALGRFWSKPQPLRMETMRLLRTVEAEAKQACPTPMEPVERPEVTVETDASQYAWGGIVTVRVGLTTRRFATHQMFQPHVR